MTNPKLLHGYVDLLSSKIRPGVTPVRVAVVPDAYAQVNDCFLNVERKVSGEGGRIQYGWAIWELPGLFIEAEHHAVWADPNWHLVDVTPRLDRLPEILFLSDDSAVFDESATRRRDNIRLAIKDHPAVHEFLKISAEYNKFLEDSTDPTHPRLMKMDRRAHEMLFHRKIQGQFKMESLPIGRNDMCRCGSAKKYKRCCGQ